MNVRERNKLKFRSFKVSEFFVRCRRTYVLKNTKKTKGIQKKNIILESKKVFKKNATKTKKYMKFF